MTSVIARRCRSGLKIIIIIIRTVEGEGSPGGVAQLQPLSVHTARDIRRSGAEAAQLLHEGRSGGLGAV